LELKEELFDGVGIGLPSKGGDDFPLGIDLFEDPGEVGMVAVDGDLVEIEGKIGIEDESGGLVDKVFGRTDLVEIEDGTEEGGVEGEEEEGKA